MLLLSPDPASRISCKTVLKLLEMNDATAEELLSVLPCKNFLERLGSIAFRKDWDSHRKYGFYEVV